MRRTPLEDEIIVPHLKDPDPHPQYKKGGGVDLDDATPAAEPIGATAIVGTSTKAAHGDHRHSLPGLATAISDGFMSHFDKIRIDSLASTAGSATWYAGTGAPDPGLGSAGSFYFDKATADVWVNVVGTWTNTINIVGAWLAAIATSGSGADLVAATVTLAKLALQADQTLLGNVSGSPASPSALTATQVATMLADWKAQLLYDFKANVVLDATTSITLGTAHRGGVLRTTNGSAVTVTLPNSLEIGYSVTVVQDGAGQITFSAGSGATLNNRSGQTKVAGQYGMVTLLVTANAGGSSAVYVLAGDTA